MFRPLTGLPDDYAHDKTCLARQHLRDIGLPPERIIYIGDTLHDEQTADALGCACVLVGWGHADTDRLAATGRPLAQTPRELLAILGL